MFGFTTYRARPVD